MSGILQKTMASAWAFSLFFAYANTAGRAGASGPTPGPASGSSSSSSSAPVQTSTPMPLPEVRHRSYARTLHFPRDKSVGILFLQKWNGPDKKLTDETLTARGDIVVPANCTTRLEVGETFFLNPLVIKDLSPDSVDVLLLRLSSMADAEEGLVDRSLAHIGHLKGLQAIYMDRSDASDKGLMHLAGLTNLKLIEAGNCLVQGRSLKYLTGLKELATLRFPSAALDQESLRYLKEFPKLDQLALTRTGMNAAGLKYISSCTGLKVLQLNQNKNIGDSELQYLLPLKKLAIIELGNTAVTVAGLAQLRALPLRRIITPQSHYSAEDMAKLHKMFPHVELDMAHESAIQAQTDDLKGLLGPISR